MADVLSPMEIIQQKFLGAKNVDPAGLRAYLEQQARAQAEGGASPFPDLIADTPSVDTPTRAVARGRASTGAGTSAPTGFGAAVAKAAGPALPTPPIPPTWAGNDYNTPTNASVRAAAGPNIGQQVVQGAPITRPGQTVASDYATPVDDVNRVITDEPNRGVSAPRPPPTTSAEPGSLDTILDNAVADASPSTVKAPAPPPPPTTTSSPPPPAATPTSVPPPAPSGGPGTQMPSVGDLPDAVKSLFTDAGGLIPNNTSLQAALALAALAGIPAATILGPMLGNRMTGGPSPSGMSPDVFRPGPAEPTPSTPPPVRPGSTGAVGTAPATLPNAPQAAPVSAPPPQAAPAPQTTSAPPPAAARPVATPPAAPPPSPQLAPAVGAAAAQKPGPRVKPPAERPIQSPAMIRGGMGPLPAHDPTLMGLVNAMLAKAPRSAPRGIGGVHRAVPGGIPENYAGPGGGGGGLGSGAEAAIGKRLRELYQ